MEDWKREKKDKFPEASERVPIKNGTLMAYFDKWDGFIGVLSGKSEMREQPAYSTPEEKYAKFYSYNVVHGRGGYGGGSDSCTSNSDVARYSWCLFHGTQPIVSRFLKGQDSNDLAVADKTVDIEVERRLLVRWIFTWKKKKE
jgi:hypothetical protein